MQIENIPEWFVQLVLYMDMNHEAAIAVGLLWIVISIVAGIAIGWLFGSGAAITVAIFAVGVSGVWYFYETLLALRAAGLIE